MKKTTLGFLSLLASGMIFGSFGVLIRLLSAELDTYQQIAARNTTGFLLAIIIAVVLKSSWRLSQVGKKHVLLYVLSTQLVTIFFTLAILNTKIGVAIFAAYIGTVPTSILIGIWYFKESMTRLKAIGLGLVFVGLLFFVAPSFSSGAVNVGFFMGLFAGIMDGVSYFSGKFLAGKIDRFVLIAIQMFGSVLLAGMMMAYTGSSFTPHMSPFTVLIAILFGAGLISISFLTLFGLQNFDLGIGSVVISSEIFFGTLFALLIFHERPNTYEFIGGILIVLAIILVNYEDLSAFYKKSFRSRSANESHR